MRKFFLIGMYLHYIRGPEMVTLNMPHDGTDPLVTPDAEEATNETSKILPGPRLNWTV